MVNASDTNRLRFSMCILGAVHSAHIDISNASNWTDLNFYRHIMFDYMLQRAYNAKFIRFNFPIWFYVICDLVYYNSSYGHKMEIINRSLLHKNNGKSVWIVKFDWFQITRWYVCMRSFMSSATKSLKSRFESHFIETTIEIESIAHYVVYVVHEEKTRN